MRVTKEIAQPHVCSEVMRATQGGEHDDASQYERPVQ